MWQEASHNSFLLRRLHFYFYSQSITNLFKMRSRLKILQADKVSSCSRSLPVSCVVDMKTSMVKLEDANV